VILVVNFLCMSSAPNESPAPLDGIERQRAGCFGGAARWRDLSGVRGAPREAGSRRQMPMGRGHLVLRFAAGAGQRAIG